MATINQVVRLLHGQHFGKLFNSGKLGMLQAVRPITIQSIPAKTTIIPDHDLKNIDLRRPMSPHLTIYAQELQSFLSISHRMSGMALAYYTTVLAVGAVALPHDITHYIDAINAMNLNPMVLFGGKFILALPVTYHTLNGIRHLFWDMGKFLNIKQVLSTGYMIMVLTVAANIGICLL